jgi:hypothetical protein
VINFELYVSIVETDPEPEYVKPVLIHILYLFMLSLTLLIGFDSLIVLLFSLTISVHGHLSICL